jgi:DNA-binding transcriptional MocR family regulator
MASWTPSTDHLNGPLYLAIADQIAEAIGRGELTAGSRLPTQRELALRLGVSTQTVSQAYAEAERRGLVIGEIGRGTFVRLGLSEPSEAHFIMDRRSERLIDLSINRPIYDQLHTDRVRAALIELGERGDVSSMLVCRPIAGLDQHRQAGAAWLRRRGIDVSPERILVCNGAAHGLTVALATLTRPGDLVATEVLVDHGTIELARVLHLRLLGLPIDEEGILPDAFEAACAGGEIRVLCATPCLSNPTVALMGEERRREIAAIAQRFGVPIVENDVYGFLAADAPPPLWSYLPDQSYYVTSFTKFAVSGLRVGYLAAPAGMISRLRRSLRATSWMATPLMAELASRWIHDGTADELLAWQRRQLAIRHQILDEVLGDFAHASHPQSLHVWLPLPEPWRGEVFVSEARLQNVAITPAEPFAIDRSAIPHAVRISVGAARGPDQLHQGLAIVRDLLRRDPEPFYMPT